MKNNEAELQGKKVTKAEFVYPVCNADNLPENMFHQLSNQSSRCVDMWWMHGSGLMCKHKEKYFFVPAANIKYLNFE